MRQNPNTNPNPNPSSPPHSFSSHSLSAPLGDGLVLASSQHISSNTRPDATRNFTGQDLKYQGRSLRRPAPSPAHISIPSSHLRYRMLLWWIVGRTDGSSEQRLCHSWSSVCIRECVYIVYIYKSMLQRYGVNRYLNLTLTPCSSKIPTEPISIRSN